MTHCVRWHFAEFLSQPGRKKATSEEEGTFCSSAALQVDVGQLNVDLDAQMLHSGFSGITSFLGPRWLEIQPV